MLEQAATTVQALEFNDVCKIRCGLRITVHPFHNCVKALPCCALQLQHSISVRSLRRAYWTRTGMWACKAHDRLTQHV